jgi:sugar/nucleoside kinase (ribokinase family)
MRWAPATGSPAPTFRWTWSRDGVVLAAGYLKLRSWDDAALAQLFGHARAQGSIVVLNVCIPIHGDVDPARCLRLLPQVDVFVPNQDEARILTGESRPADQARLLCQAGARMVIITRGQQGLYATDGLQAIEMGVFPVEMIDPSGCGDCFTAGLIAGLLRRWELSADADLRQRRRRVERHRARLHQRCAAVGRSRTFRQ